ncbi:MAG: single-stranded DNA-binding protein [Candidatus Omnitrophota bacterium]|nr:single-stranded DNA-binding protein [Candidatus Omnitrophota bacterium]
MANFNKVFLMGNLTKDPELRYTPQGTAVANLRMAVNRKFRNKNQELKEETCFISAVVWDKQAETCNQYLKKGSALFVEGRLQSRSWEDNAGQKRSIIEVKAERVQFLGSPRSGQSQEPFGAGLDSPKDESFVRSQTGSIESAQDLSTEAAWLGESEEQANEN